MSAGAPPSTRQLWLPRLAEKAGGRPETGALIAAGVLFAFFSAWADNFLTTQSLASMLTISAELGIVAIAVTLLMIAGEFDLSVGSILGMSSILLPYSMVNWGFDPVSAVLFALAAGTTIGLLNGILLVTVRIPSFIITLGALLFWRGLIAVITNGFPVSIPGDPGFLQLFGHRFASGFNVSSLWFVGAVVVAWLLLSRSPWGSWIFASGGSNRAARSMGIPVDRVHVALFAFSGLTAALVGVIQAARFDTVDPARGQNFELEAIAAAVIGGSRLTGGYGSIIGTVLGCLMIGMIRNGLVLGGVADYWYTTIIGLLIVVAVIINQVAGRTREPKV
jgi:simple sugar transport system permease protein